VKALLRTVCVLLVLAGAGAATWWYVKIRPETGQAGAQTAPLAPAAAPRGMPVEVRPVKVTTIEETITVVGTLRSNESVLVRPEVAGRIASFGFREGERVEKGAPLVTLDSDIYQAELEEAKANLLLSRRNNERAVELFQRNAGTARQRDEAAAKLKVDEAKVALAEANLRRTRVFAPFSGIVGLRGVSLGAYVQPGQDIVNLESIDPIKVEFRVPEVRFRALKTGQALSVEVDAIPGAAFVGEVYAIDPRLDAAGRSVAIRAQVPNREGLLRPGMFARVQLMIDSRPNAIVVPEIALVPQGSDQLVYRVVDGKAVATKVRLGLRQRGEVEIAEGLRPDDRIVVAGQEKLRDGAPVAVLAAGS